MLFEVELRAHLASDLASAISEGPVNESRVGPPSYGGVLINI